MSTFGKIAYEAYTAYSGGVSLISGAPLPEWPEQAEEIRDAWDAAAWTVLRRAMVGSNDVARELADVHDELVRARAETKQAEDRAALIDEDRTALTVVAEAAATAVESWTVLRDTGPGAADDLTWIVAMHALDNLRARFPTIGPF